MQLSTIIQAQQSGALKIHKNEENGAVTLAGRPVTKQELDAACQWLGWTHWEKNSADIVDKTAKFAKAMAEANDSIIEGTEVEFLNRRIQDTMKFFDRIHMVNPRIEMTLLYGMPRVGGAYALYINGQHIPTHTTRSLKTMVQYINDNYS